MTEERYNAPKSLMIIQHAERRINYFISGPSDTPKAYRMFQARITRGKGKAFRAAAKALMLGYTWMGY